KDKKKQIRPDASHGKVVVAVPGIIEMKTAQFSFVDQNAYDLFQIGIGQVMSQINQYVGLFAQFGAEQVRRSPVLDYGRIKVGFIRFIFHQKLPVFGQGFVNCLEARSEEHTSE